MRRRRGTAVTTPGRLALTSSQHIGELVDDELVLAVGQFSPAARGESVSQGPLKRRECPGGTGGDPPRQRHRDHPPSAAAAGNSGPGDVGDRRDGTGPAASRYPMSSMALRATSTAAISSGVAVPTCSSSRERSTGSIVRSDSQPCASRWTLSRPPGSRSSTCAPMTTGRAGSLLTPSALRIRRRSDCPGRRSAGRYAQIWPRCTARSCQALRAASRSASASAKNDGSLAAHAACCAAESARASSRSWRAAAAAMDPPR